MKLRKKLIALSALTLSLIMVVPVFADNPIGWQKNETGWWYGTNAAGTTWYHDGWQWIDGNKDGISECYYFTPNGYIVTNGKTPDGYDVNADAQWTINGVVQTIGAAAAQATGTANTNRPSSKENLDYLYYYFVYLLITIKDCLVHYNLTELRIYPLYKYPMPFLSWNLVHSCYPNHKNLVLQFQVHQN